MLKRYSLFVLFSLLLFPHTATAFSKVSTDSIFSVLSMEAFDSLLTKEARPVVFKVRSNELSAEDEQWIGTTLRSELEAIGPKGYIYIRSSASPEGIYDYNVHLANTRMQAVLDVLKQKGFDISRVRQEIVPEDYTLLVFLMQASNDRDTEIVRNIVESTSDDASTKAALQEVNDGQLWERLLNMYFPSLRTVRVVASVPRPKKVVPVVEVPDTIVVELNDPIVVVEAVEPVDTVELDIVFPEEEPELSYPILSVKTNLLYDFFYTPQTGFQFGPDIELEYYFRNGWLSVLAEYQFPWWKNEEKREFFQLQNWQLEPRYYFKHDHWFNGHYLGVYGMFNRYDFALKGNDGSGVQGEGAGVGISYGYVLPLGKKSSRWKLEFNIKAGYYETRYDPYDYEINPNTGEGKYYYRWEKDPNLFVRRNWRYRWLGPTGVGIKVSYDLFRGYKSLNEKTN